MRAAITAVVLTLALSSVGAAQDGVRLGYFGGLTAATQHQAGLIGGFSVTVPTPLSFAAVRAEGLFQQALYRDFLVMADVLVTPLPSRPAFYGIAGYGFYLDGGGDVGPMNWAWNAGAGVDVGRISRVPIFLEYRSFFARSQFSTFSVGVHF